MFQMNEEIGRKVLSVVDQGLSKGLGTRGEGDEQGEMCVEAAVCYALDLPHGDDPGCVSLVLRSLKIRLNDSNWSSKKARAKGLRRLAIAQLGSKGNLDEKKFVKRLADYAIYVSTPNALRSAASICKNEKHKAALCEAANRCEKEGTRNSAINANKVAYAAAYAADAAAAYAAAYAAAAADAAAYAADAADAAADAAAYAADAAAAYAAKKQTRDKSLAAYAEAVVQILIDLKVPGCEYLYLTE